MIQTTEATCSPGEGETSTSFLPHKCGRILRKVTFSGSILLLIGLTAAATASGVLFLLLGLALVSGTVAVRIHFRSQRGQDRAAAQHLANGLRLGRLPASVDPAGLRARGQELEPGENCYVDQLKVEGMQWYGEAIVRHNRLFLAWGSPLAWIFSITATLMFWSHDRKQAKAAAPSWRDPEPATLWVTDRRLIVHGESGHKSWVQIRWEHVRNMWLESDGVALMIDDFPPMKLRMGPAAWTFVALNYFGWGRVVDPECSQ